jgi:NADH-quinone oxidoreductase subunit C
MFGIRFLYHPELTRILSDYGFKGHPLRKDFPLYGYVDLYYSDISNKCILKPVVLSQASRNFTFTNP